VKRFKPFLFPARLAKEQRAQGGKCFQQTTNNKQQTKKEMVQLSERNPQPFELIEPIEPFEPLNSLN